MLGADIYVSELARPLHCAKHRAPRGIGKFTVHIAALPK